jgi:hypothetical protein
MIEDPVPGTDPDLDNVYEYNFLTKQDRTLLKEGPRKARKHWLNHKYGKSHWLNLRRSDYGGEKHEPKAYLEQEED